MQSAAIQFIQRNLSSFLILCLFLAQLLISTGKWSLYIACLVWNDGEIPWYLTVLLNICILGTRSKGKAWENWQSRYSECRTRENCWRREWLGLIINLWLFMISTWLHSWELFTISLISIFSRFSFFLAISL